MVTAKVKAPPAGTRLTRTVTIVDRFPGTTRRTLKCPICRKPMTLDSRPHRH